ncbi:Sir2 family NAD+-dependent deacetylase [Pasteurella bettyae]|uniref:NAD-dependent protein deacylase n=1 Tax=Pasteurella bettyae CCUG 2042 TaxID=1095749 RepID=I3DFB9_9PAST|nr:Sir2 family NAD+-dependent deacetylase [Pasteurella bettyae]EIJ70412.1 transcriptional regulator, Sir2 family [Pasteurella bettyae CCUG 2042]SUB21084.1 NAD-dependent deacetylase [Pasteurella bettyae]
MKKDLKIVVLTGAGISAESGIRTFRAEDGLWENHRVEDVATPEGYKRDRELVQRFYNERRRKLFDPEVQPNAAHLALAELEVKLGENMLIVTQNVDNLHERAGSKNVIHMHGELLKVRCPNKGSAYEWQGDVTDESRCTCCVQPARLRPHIVWFGEMPLEMARIEKALMDCDIFVSIGTSGNVYPAAGFVQVANNWGAKTVELNLEPSKVKNAFQDAKYGKASEIVPEFVKAVLAQLEK